MSLDPTATLDAVAGNVHCLVPAAGAGTRFASDRPKQFLELGGRPLVAWTVARLLAAGATSITLALPEEVAAAPPDWIATEPRIRPVAGGATRQASVALALAACPAEETELVAVHDGARPLVAFEDLLAVCAAAARPGVDGAVLGRRLADTLKRLAGDRVESTVDRSALFRAETPQVYRRRTLSEALAAAAEARFVGTDESSLVERLPERRIVAVEARHPNPKLTRPEDLALVEALLRRDSPAAFAGEWR